MVKTGTEVFRMIIFFVMAQSTANNYVCLHLSNQDRTQNSILSFDRPFQHAKIQ